MMKREKIKMLSAIVFTLLAMGIFSLWSYFREEERLIAQVDKRLYSAAVAIPFVLDDDFHDRAVDAQSITTGEDQRNIENLSKLNNRLGTKFLYSVVRGSDGTYRLSSSSALKKELETKKEVRYFSPYPDVSIMMKQSFEASATNFSHRNDVYHEFYVPIFSDRWGTYRSIFIPMRSPSGNAYMVGADIDISHVKTLLRKNILDTILTFLFFTLAILPIVYAYISMLRQKNREYLRVHRLYLDQSKRSVTDPLTQIYNRSKLDEELEVALHLFHKHGRIFSLLMADLDYFKAVNDSYGHQVGDSVLQEIAKLLTQSSRSADIVGRWGGEEFMIICLDIDLNGAYSLAEKLRKLIEIYSLAHPYGISASFGVAEPRSNEELPQLLKRVDEALYTAKRMGRNRTVKANGHTLG
jgi:diguanylate cyclase (GGDEF)-like protein